jgi:hypothetical protein
MDSEKSPLTRSETSRSLQAFLMASGLWDAWGKIVGIGTSVYTGYALHLGADESFIAFSTSIIYLLAAFQIIAPMMARYIKSQKRFIIGGGLIETTFRAAPLLIPFLFPAAWRLKAFVVFVSLSLLSSYSISPFTHPGSPPSFLHKSERALPAANRSSVP